MSDCDTYVKEFKRRANLAKNSNDLKLLCWAVLYEIADDYDRSGYIARQLLDIVNELLNID